MGWEILDLQCNSQQLNKEFIPWSQKNQNPARALLNMLVLSNLLNIAQPCFRRSMNAFLERIVTSIH